MTKENPYRVPKAALVMAFRILRRNFSTERRVYLAQPAENHWQVRTRKNNRVILDIWPTTGRYRSGESFSGAVHLSVDMTGEQIAVAFTEPILKSLMRKSRKRREFAAAARHLKAAGKQPPAYAETFLHKPCRLLSSLCAIAGHDAEMPAGSLVLVVNGGYTSDEEDEDDDNYRFTVVLLTRHGTEDKANVSSGYVSNYDLQVEPGVITWSAEHSFDAMGQGWDIFDCDGSVDGPLQLCKLDDPNAMFDTQVTGVNEGKCREPFETDEDAWSWVWARALLGDTTCKKALEFLYARAPKEYARVRKHCTTKKPKE